MKSMFKKGEKVALFTPDANGEMRYVGVVYIAKVYRGFVSISHSQDGYICNSGFEIVRGSHVCRKVIAGLKQELRPVDEACERLEENRILRDNLIRSAVRLEAIAKATNIETLSDLVGPKELSYFLEIADALVKKLGDRY
jgi:hypothetical protein